MTTKYSLIFDGQKDLSEDARSAVVELLENEHKIGKVLEIQELIDNPPFLVKSSRSLEEIEQNANKLKSAGAQTAIVSTIQETKTLARSIQKSFYKDPSTNTYSPFSLFFKKYSKKLSEILKKMDTQVAENLASDLVAARYRKSQIFIIGNGGSAAAASHFATDLAKQRFPEEETMFRVMSLSDNLPWMSATANDFGYENVFVQQLKNLLQPNDIVIAISSSGNSANIIKGVEYANSKGAITYGVVGFDGGKLLHTAQKNIFIPTKKGQYGYMEDVTGILTHIISVFIYEQDVVRRS